MSGLQDRYRSWFMARLSVLKPVDIGICRINLLYYVQFDGH